MSHYLTIGKQLILILRKVFTNHHPLGPGCLGYTQHIPFHFQCGELWLGPSDVTSKGGPERGPSAPRHETANPRHDLSGTAIGRPQLTPLAPLAALKAVRTGSPHGVSGNRSDSGMFLPCSAFEEAAGVSWSSRTGG